LQLLENLVGDIDDDDDDDDDGVNINRASVKVLQRM
jgi:Mg2+/Co2+ transporter CorC